MSKHYNLTVTDDNGKSVTTSNTSTEHPEEVLRMMQLAGMHTHDASCGCGESIEENEYQPTPANDKLDLDDYSKKSGESIPKQKKSLDKAPSRGDNPLEYSLDENEIFESLMNEFEEVEEGKLNPGLQAYLDKKKGKKDDKEDKEDKVEEKKAKPDFADIDGDGDKKETMKKAAKDKKEKSNESIDEIQDLKKLAGIKQVEAGPSYPGEYDYMDPKYMNQDGSSKADSDSVAEIMAKHPQDVAKMKQTGDLDTGSELYMDLMDYFSDEMPYDTMKARDGDPVEFIMSKLDDMGMMEAKVGTPGSLEKVEAQIKKLKDMAQKAKDDGDPQKANTIQSSDEMTELLRKQRKLKNESVEEGFEADEVKAILAKHGVSNIDDMELDGELYQDLFNYYSDEMPYGTQKARDGDPMDWIISRLDDLGMVESTSEQNELNRLRKLANIEKASSEEVEQVDEILPAAIVPVAKAVGGALLKKGIKGAVARTGAGMAVKKAMGSNNQA